MLCLESRNRPLFAPCAESLSTPSIIDYATRFRQNPRVQVEPGALSSKQQLQDFASRYCIFHYTYQFEYMLDGTACKRNQPHNQPHKQPWCSVPSSL